jgi:hypothetical protein
VQRVIGKEGKAPLFCVYTMIRQSLRDALLLNSQQALNISNNANDGTAEKIDKNTLIDPLLLSRLQRDEEDRASCAVDLTVRDLQGAWTPLYADMLREISYPVASLHPSGEY